MSKINIVDAATNQIIAALVNENGKWATSTTDAPAPPKAENGWTLLTPSPASRLIHVSSSTGNDANDGSKEKPIKTLFKAMTLSRKGYPDWVLLKCGDTWQEAFTGVNLSGKSAEERAVVTSYGVGPRPKVVCDTEKSGSCLHFFKKNNAAVTDIHFTAKHRVFGKPDFKVAGGGSGIRGTDSFNLLIEGCFIECFKVNIVLEGDMTKGIVVRRNVIVDAYSVGKGFSQGIYTAGVEGFVCEENVFDGNGWNPNVPEAAANIFNHGLYNDSERSTHSFVRNNIFTRSSSTGVQQKMGGEMVNNLYMLNGPACDAWIGGTKGLMKDNVVLGTKDATTRETGGGLLVLGGDVLAVNNILAHGPRASTMAALTIGKGSDKERALYGDVQVTWDGNIVYNWGGDGFGASYERVLTYKNNYVIKNNRKAVNMKIPLDKVKFVGNVFDSQAKFYHMNKRIRAVEFDSIAKADDKYDVRVTFADPSRCIESYAEKIGVGRTHADFMAAARKQRRGNWDEKLTADAVNKYIREGFKIVSVNLVPSTSSSSSGK